MFLKNEDVITVHYTKRRASRLSDTILNTVRILNPLYKKWPTRFYFRHKNRQYEFTVENITASLVYHEWLGHMQMDWGDGDQNASASNHGTHYACYLAVIISPIFGKTTSAYQNFNTYMFNTLFK